MVTCAILAHAARISGNSKVMHARIAHVTIALLIKLYQIVSD